MSWRFLRIAVPVLGSVLLVGAVLWAFRPMPNAEAVLAKHSATTSPGTTFAAPVARDLRVPLDMKAFDTPLWVAPAAPPAPPVPPPPPPPPPPIKLQLIAVITEPLSGTDDARLASVRALSAVFYDPDGDRVVTLKVGDSLVGRRIDAITDKGVTFLEGTTRRQLALREAPTEMGLPSLAPRKDGSR